MIRSFGPWATAASAGSKAHLSAFWKRRLAMLPATHRSSSRLGGRAVLCLVMAAALVWGLPALRGAAAAPTQKEDRDATSPARARVVAGASKNMAASRPGVVGLPLTPPAEASVTATSWSTSITTDALILLLTDVGVPAPQAGVLTTVKVAAGDKVKKGDLLGIVHDQQGAAPESKIVAPIDGEVVSVLLQEGEWADRGKTVARLIRLKQVVVEGYLDWNRYPPESVHSRKVEALVHSGKQGEITFPGRIVFTNPQVEAGGQYRVRAVVENRQRDGFWLLVPGLQVRLRILKEKAQ